jgi:hypothetical protein
MINRYFGDIQNLEAKNHCIPLTESLQFCFQRCIRHVPQDPFGNYVVQYVLGLHDPQAA